MKMIAKMLLIVALLAGISFVSGCGTVRTTTTAAKAAEATQATTSMTPHDLLAKALVAPEPTTFTAEFEANLTFELDKSKIPAGTPVDEMAVVENPMALSGTITASNTPLAADAKLKVSMSGRNTALDIKIVDDYMYLGYAGRWYDGPSEMNEVLGNSMMNTMLQAIVEGLLTQSGIDPTSWITDAHITARETVNGLEAYHLTGRLDVDAVLADFVKIMESEAFKDLEAMGSDGSGYSSTPDESFEEATGLDEETLSQMTQMFELFDVDLWIAADSYAIVGWNIDARLVPPPGEDSEGLEAVNLTAKMTLKDLDEPVTVVAPTAVETYEAFGVAISSDQTMIDIFEEATEITDDTEF
jgi:uncharacterized protein YceK